MNRQLSVLVISGPSDRSQVITRAGQGINVVGGGGPPEAAALAARYHPDAILMEFDGGRPSLAAIEEIMAQVPTPILLLSHPAASSPAVVRAIDAGALDALPYPGSGAPGAWSEVTRQLHVIAKVRVIRHVRMRAGAPAPGLPVIGIGASTGGPQALARVLADLSGVAAAVLIVQHMTPEFVDSFHEWMSRESALAVEMATDGSTYRPQVVYIAPRDHHLRVAAGTKLALTAEPATLHRPSVDILFESMAVNLGRSGIGVLLSGMGEDGAAGLLNIRRQGGRTVAQDEASSAVYGMPRAADRLGAVEQVLPLARIGAELVRLANRVALAR